MDCVFLIFIWGFPINFLLDWHLGYLQNQYSLLLVPFFCRFRWMAWSKDMLEDVSKLVRSVWDKEMIFDFLIDSCINQPFQETDLSYMLFFLHLESCLSHVFLQTRGPWSPKMIWFHRSMHQFWWPLTHIEQFSFCLDVSSGFEIDILLPYSNWWCVQSVEVRETATPASFLVLKILP